MIFHYRFIFNSTVIYLVLKIQIPIACYQTINLFPFHFFLSHCLLRFIAPSFSRMCIWITISLFIAHSVLFFPHCTFLWHCICLCMKIKWSCLLPTKLCFVHFVWYVLLWFELSPYVHSIYFLFCVPCVPFLFLTNEKMSSKKSIFAFEKKAY